MALTDLAKFDPKGPVSLRDISLRQGISLVYLEPVSYTHLRAHETEADLVCRLLLEKK